jgi:diguanylate cyclase (GGDEF)-like protein/PAS domain S-box-containing protein/putative nucleotidyltransferase with HDIG domain
MAQPETSREVSEGIMEEFTSLDEYKIILETSSVAIMVLEEDTTVSLVNTAFEKLIGYKRGEIEGKMSWTEFVAEDDLNRMREYYRQRMTDPAKSPSTCEVRLNTSQGETRTILLTIGRVPGTKRGVASILDITGWKQAGEEQLIYMATHDVLTSLPNRVVFIDRLKLILSQSKRNKKKFAVMILDLDRFKDINDMLGTTGADELLMAIALRIRGILRENDTIARMGDDEFVFLFPEISREDSTDVVAKKILDMLRKPFLIKDHRLTITGSIGISIYPDDGEDFDTLMKNAEIAMHRVKKKGRNNYQYYNQSMIPQPARPKVLLIEGNLSYAEAIQVMLTMMRGPQCDLESVSRLSMGLKRLEDGGIDLVLVDISLPDSTGIYTATKILEHAPAVPVIVLAAINETDIATQAVKAGAQDFLIKGEVDDTLLVRSIQYAIERHRLQMELRRQTEIRVQPSETRLRAVLEDTVNAVILMDKKGIVIFANPAAQTILGQSAEELVGAPFKYDIVVGQTTESEIIHTNGEKAILELRVVETEWEDEPIYLIHLQDITEQRRAQRELKENFDRCRTALDEIILAMAATIGVRDPYITNHQKRVTTLACAIAKEMGLPEEQMEGLRLAATIHDIGKVYVPSEILSKPSELSDVEIKLIETHPLVGYEILRNVESPWPIAQIVHQHHERIDGSGYPQGLSGEDIILEAKILAVADVVEAILSRRSYRPARGIEEAMAEISYNRGVLYDPKAVDACVTLFSEKDFTFEH